ncbi:MAG: VCBS repeat-containing protein [Candidatus Zixiibacteriota bacterium]
MNRFLSYFLIPILIIGLIAIKGYNPALAADQDMFEIYSLEVEGDIYDFLSADFDGDELTDIATIYTPNDDQDARYIGLYLQKGTSGFRTVADYLVPLPPSAAQIDVADIDRDGRAEIYVIDADGVRKLTFTPNLGLSTPEPFINHKTIFAIPQFSGIIVEPFIFEINPRTGPQIIIPNASGYAVFEKGDAGRYVILNNISAPIRGTNFHKSIKRFRGGRNAKFGVSLAQIYISDGNGDGLNDLYLLWSNNLCYFFQDQSGNFAQGPDVDIDFYPVNSNGYLESVLIDCNGDSKLDAIVSNTLGGITNTETKICIYLAGGDGRIGNQPSKEITLSDSHCNLMIGDYNHDGRSDMVVPAVELGALAATKMFLMKKADLHLLIYPFENGLPDNEPVRRLQHEFRFDFDNPQPTIEVFVEWSADYNGDNLNDLVFSDGKGKLQFFWGNSDDYVSKKPDLEVSVDHPQEIHPIHLNNGIRADIIIEHDLSGRLDRLTVLKNRDNTSR